MNKHKHTHKHAHTEPHHPLSSKSVAVDERRTVASLILQVYNGSYSEEFFLDSEHGKFYRKIFLNTMRHLPFIDSLIDTHSKSTTTPALRSIIAMGIAQILFMDSVPDYAAVNTTVELTPKHQKPFVNWLLMEIARNKGTILEKHTIYDDFPNSFINNLKAHCTGTELHTLLTTLNTPPVYWGLDLNTGKIIRVDEHAQTLKTESDMQKYGVLPMDKASAMVALETVELGKKIPNSNTTPLHILDACAAPGGKTVAMAKLLPNALIHAVEINPNRFNTLRNYLQGYSASNATPLNMDIMDVTPQLLHTMHMPPTGEATNNLPQATHRWDITLLDAPCSCLGTIRRHPEVRAIKNSCDIQTLQPIQIAMLHHVAPLTQHYIHYCVCSLEPGETTDVIQGFLSTNTDFTLEQQGYIMPHLENSDGFYRAVLKRL